jgi:hypothetical protein
MGYHTDLSGSLEIDPAPTQDHAIVLRAISKERHPDVGWPSNYCPWELSENGDELEWDQTEKPRAYVEWLQYLVDQYFKPWGYALNGEVFWEGEESDDRGTIYVKDNVIEAVQDEIMNAGPSWARVTVTAPTPESVMASAAADLGPTLSDLLDDEALMKNDAVAESVAAQAAAENPELAPMFTSQELGTVLAALRYWQRKYRPEREGGANGHGVNDWLIDIATGGGEFATLDTTEIDALCERLNVQ